ncbi:MAG: 4-hydroxythreonine-4-phosphate dehydrogenase PdxA [Bacteroidales bacterium]
MEETAKSPESRMRIGITHGDINGIGYEVILKALGDARMLELFSPVIYGQVKAASFHRKFTALQELTFNVVKDANQANPKKLNIVNITENELKIDMGKATKEAGDAAYQALELAVQDLKSDKIDALVTAPINKQNIQSVDFDFPGHTEYLSMRFENATPLMLMVWNTLRVGTITGHIPLKDVPQTITKELIISKIKILNQSLIRDFGIVRPRIAILGVNPHAGDGGLLGSEEIDVVIPALEEARKMGYLVFGPFAADGFFGSGSWTKYDGVLSMYHDQGLTAFKSIAFDGGVNFTAGLPIVRTSPAHGTAYDLAGKGEADEESFRQAVYLAIDIVRSRRNFAEMTANPLKNTSHPAS